MWRSPDVQYMPEQAAGVAFPRMGACDGTTAASSKRRLCHHRGARVPKTAVGLALSRAALSSKTVTSMPLACRRRIQQQQPFYTTPTLAPLLPSPHRPPGPGLSPGRPPLPCLWRQVGAEEGDSVSRRRARAAEGAEPPRAIDALMKVLDLLAGDHLTVELRLHGRGEVVCFLPPARLRPSARLRRQQGTA